MNVDDYLSAVLKSQALAPDSAEMNTLRERRKEVEELLRSSLSGMNLTIKYGGSKAKNTMIKDSYDLDVICYFGHEETGAGETLEEIYSTVREILEADYRVEPKRSALRLREKGDIGLDSHIDIVPGRFTDDKKADAFLYLNAAEKNRLKTNLQTQIEHVRDSGLIDSIKLAKLWKWRNGLTAIKTFVLELSVIEILSGVKDDSLEEQLLSYWRYLKDQIEDLAVEDPANPKGNDLSDLLNPQKAGLKAAAENSLRTIENSGWDQVFGDASGDGGEAARIAVISSLPSSGRGHPKPWSD